MKAKQFKKLLKEYEKDLQYLIFLHTESKIYLNGRQLEQVIKLRGEKKYPHYNIINGRQVIIW